jgi:hypothetical protein
LGSTNIATTCYENVPRPTCSRTCWDGTNDSHHETSSVLEKSYQRRRTIRTQLHEVSAV